MKMNIEKKCMEININDKIKNIDNDNKNNNT